MNAKIQNSFDNGKKQTKVAGRTKNSDVQSLSQMPSSPPELGIVKGQLWQISEERFVKIGHVGRFLVHHRILLASFKRAVARESFIAIKDLREFLAKSKAVLVETPASKTRPTFASRTLASGKSRL